MTPELVANVYLYPTGRSGKKLPIPDGYRCPCSVSQDQNRDGWDCMIVTTVQAVAACASKACGYG